MASLDSLKQDKDEAQKDLKKYQKRLREVTQVRNDLTSVVNDYQEDINKKLDNALSNLINGIGVDRHEYRDTISALKQRGVNSDPHLSDCKASLDKEVNRINGKIDAANREIRSLNTRISDEKSK